MHLIDIGLKAATGIWLASSILCHAAPPTEWTAANFLEWKSFTDIPPLVGPIAHLFNEYTGLRIQGVYRGFFYGNVAGGKSTGAAWDQEIRLTGTYDLGFLTKNLKGLTLTGGVRWREGQNPNSFVGATRSFQPSHIEGGKYFRLRPFYWTYVTPELLGVPNLLTISGGWQNPYDIFLQQPLSKLLTNYAIYTAKGLGANIPWTSSYVAWGGYTQINPTDWTYAQAGLYMAIPGSTLTRNHGMDFRGSQNPRDPNSLFVIAETGVTPKIGPSHQLPGKYVFGGYWYGARPDDPIGKDHRGRYGFYWQADQQLFRVPSDPRISQHASNRHPASQYHLSEKGLYFFSMFTYAPSYHNTLSFYFQAGLVYQGLIPILIADQLCLAYGYGTYSHRFADLSQSPNWARPTHQSILEIDYKIAMTKWLSFKCFYQLLMNPAADNTFKNANILGFAINASF